MLLFDNLEVSYNMTDYGVTFGPRFAWHTMNTPSDTLDLTFDIGEHDPMDVMVNLLVFVYDPESEYAWPEGPATGYRPIYDSGKTYGGNCPDGWDTEVYPSYSENVEAVLVIVDVMGMDPCTFTVGLDD